MITALLALAAATAPSTAGAPDFERCAALAKETPEQAVVQAEQWRLQGGGAKSRQCLGLAYAGLERWAPAATAFEGAALEAEKAKQPGASDLWAQAGNAWIAADDAAKARAALDRALLDPTLAQELRGEVHLDRARALVALGDLAGARGDLDKGLSLVPGDPFGWYLSAALAQREDKLPRARSDIDKAVSLAPDDADVLLLAGNIAGLAGDLPKAREWHERAARLAPETPAGKAAAAALAANATAEPLPAQ
jgi:tetratricopeptide (TPR) repeat protein